LSEQQEMDSLPSLPSGLGAWEETVIPRIRVLRWARSLISPSIINVSSQSVTTILREHLGDWVARTAPIGQTATLISTFKVSALGRPIEGAPVTLFLAGEKVAEGETNENGEVSFPHAYTDVGVYDYVAVLGKKLPAITVGNPRAVPFRVRVWTIVTRSRNVSDVWARWQGRAFFRGLPWIFWTEQPSSVVGLAGRPIGFVDLVPAPDGVTIPMELGVSAYCNTPEPSPTAERCCEYAKNTWWMFEVFATSDPRQVPDTVAGAANKIGGDQINLDYHLKYNIDSASVTYRGRYLKYQRCPWEAGTAPMDP